MRPQDEAEQLRVADPVRLGGGREVQRRRCGTAAVDLDVDARAAADAHSHDLRVVELRAVGAEPDVVAREQELEDLAFARGESTTLRFPHPGILTFASVPRRMAVERTLILVKPDGVERKLAGEVLRRFENRGFAIRAARLVKADEALGGEHYDEHREKPFFGELITFITSGPTLALVLEGEGAIATARETIGATNPANADPGSIRGDLALAMPNNLVHGSDSPESAEREIALWFPDGLV